MDRQLSADVMVVDLGTDLQQPPAQRGARTLLKTDALTVTRITVLAGGEIAEHSAPGAITVLVLMGEIRFTAGGNDYDLGPGRLLYLDAGIRHRVSSRNGGTFLLTLASRPAKAGA